MQMWTTTMTTSLSALVVLVMMMMMVVDPAQGHGRMMRPVQRASLWRVYPNSGFQSDYNDMGLFCGGTSKQWNQNGGKCGICGDAYDSAQPRKHEAPGLFATGFIAETYQEAAVIDVTVHITANHLGYFEFKLCATNDVDTEATQDCLDENVLKVVGSNGEDLGEKYYVDSSVGDKHLRLQLPQQLTCSQCVLQWTYNTGNNWGCDDSGCCLGCGAQENFVNCADVSITPSSSSTTTTNDDNNTPTPNPTTEQEPSTTTPPPDTTTTATTTTTPATTPTTTTPTTTTTTPTTSTITTTPTTTTLATTTTTTTPTTTTTTTPTTTTTTTPTTTTTTTTTTTPPPAAGESGIQCVAVAPYDAVPGMVWWCEINCEAGYCPPSHCSCSK